MGNTQFGPTCTTQGGMLIACLSNGDTQGARTVGRTTHAAARGRASRGRDAPIAPSIAARASLAPRAA
jgi:hypothetical protein